MYYITKFLLLPLVMIGVIGNNCYSMEIDDDITYDYDQTIPIIKYTDQTATWKQWAKCANFEEINVHGNEYKNIYNFCKEHNLYSLINGINYLLINIYKLAHTLNGNELNDNKYFVDETIDWEINIMQIINYNNIKIESNSLDAIIKPWKTKTDNNDWPILAETKTSNDQFLVNIVSSIIGLQKKLNKTKYSKCNDISNIPLMKNFDIHFSFKYIANKLVQLSHDIVYAINNEINEYKSKKLSDKEIYEYFRKYLINEITIPCYNLLIEAFLYNDEFTINNISLPEHNICEYAINETSYEYVNKILKYCFKKIKSYKYNFIYDFSKLGRKLSKDVYEIINILHDGLNKIKEQNKKTKFIKSENINKALNTLCKLEKYYMTRIVYLLIVNYDHYYCGKLVKNINKHNNNITEKQIIETANTCLQRLLDDIKNMIYCVNTKMWELDYENSQGDKEMEQYKTKIEDLMKKLESKVTELQIPNNSNTDYLTDIKQLLSQFKFV